MTQPKINPEPELKIEQKPVQQDLAQETVKTPIPVEDKQGE